MSSLSCHLIIDYNMGDKVMSISFYNMSTLDALTAKNNWNGDETQPPISKYVYIGAISIIFMDNEREKLGR